MKTSIQQEILLIKGTSFSSRQCWQKNENNQDLSETEQLQEACCNGLLPEILPEICGDNKHLFLWKINESSSCIEIELGEFPEIMEKDYSIDPYSFIRFHRLN